MLFTMMLIAYFPTKSIGVTGFAHQSPSSNKGEEERDQYVYCRQKAWQADLDECG